MKLSAGKKSLGSSQHAVSRNDDDTLDSHLDPSVDSLVDAFVDSCLIHASGFHYTTCVTSICVLTADCVRRAAVANPFADRPPRDVIGGGIRLLKTDR